MKSWRKLGMAVAVFVIMFELASGNFVFKVQHKFAGKEKKLAHFKSHDTRRHSRMLASIDLPLGGDSRVDSVGLYFTRIKIGTPPKEYHVQVDTGSDILWINCSPCPKCPSETNLGFSLSLYDTKASSTSNKVGCEDDFCSFISDSESCQSDIGCSYHIVYADESTSDGNFIRDKLTLDQVTGDLQTGPLGQEIVFGCGSDQSGQLGKSESAVDGVMGFGQANTSVLSQLAASGDAKRVFSHCLDNVKGGGIFAVGAVDSPTVKTTPLVPNQETMASSDEDGNESPRGGISSVQMRALNEQMTRMIHASLEEINVRLDRIQEGNSYSASRLSLRKMRSNSNKFGFLKSDFVEEKAQPRRPREKPNRSSREQSRPARERADHDYNREEPKSLRASLHQNRLKREKRFDELEKKNDDGLKGT